MPVLLKDVLQPNQIVRLKTLDRFVSYFGTAPRRLNKHQPAYLLIIIKNGYGHCFVDNEYVPLIAGSLLLISPDSYLRLDNTQYLLGNVIIFTEAFFCKTQFTENLLYKVVYDPESKPIVQLNEGKIKTAFINSRIQLFSLEYRMLKDKSADNDLLLNMLSGIILMLHQEQLEQNGQSYDNENPHLKNIVVKFIKLLNIHYKEQHQLEFYARKMGVDVSTFSKLCRKACGWSPKSIIQSKLINEVRLSMIFDPRPTSEISFELGFQEHSAFNKFFREELKISIAEFKAANPLK